METIIEKEQQEARIIKEWISHPGWEIINTDLSQKSKELTTSLIEGNNPEEDIYIKAEIRAIKLFIEKIVSKATKNTES